MDKQHKKLNKEQETQTKLAANLALNFLVNEKALPHIQQAVQKTGDPAQALGTIVLGAIAKARQELEKRGAKIFSGVWLAAGGVVDRVVKGVLQLMEGTGTIKGALDPNLFTAVRAFVTQQMGAQDGQMNSGPSPDQSQGQGQSPQGLVAPPSSPMMGGMPNAG